MKKALLMVALAAAVAGGALGCGGKGGADKAASAADTAARQPPSFSTFTDTRDGKVYKTVKIGRQNWFAENLNYAAEGSKCYDNKEKNCAKYGRLYSWETALKACPAGYHLQTEDEWRTLTDYVGGKMTAGTKLKSAAGWNEYMGKSGNGTNDYGFSALPAGYCRRAYDGGDDFTSAGFNAVWWTDTEVYYTGEVESGDTTRNVYVRHMDYYHERVDNVLISKDETDLYSVRCVADDSVLDDSDISNKEAQK